MPTVAMNVPERKAPSLNWSRKQVFPTPESPSNITCKMGAGRGVSGTGRAQLPRVVLSPSPVPRVPLFLSPRLVQLGLGTPLRAGGGMGPPRVQPGDAPGQRSSPQPPKRGRAEEESWWEGRYRTEKRCLRAGPWPSPSPAGSWRTGRNSRTHGVASTHALPPAPGVPSPRGSAWLGQTPPRLGLSPCLPQTPKQTRCLFPSC